MFSVGEIALLLFTFVLPSEALRLEKDTSKVHKTQSKLNKTSWESPARPNDNISASAVNSQDAENYRSRLNDLEKMYDNLVDASNKHHKKLRNLVVKDHIAKTGDTRWAAASEPDTRSVSMVTRGPDGALGDSSHSGSRSASVNYAVDGASDAMAMKNMQNYGGGGDSTTSMMDYEEMAHYNQWSGKWTPEGRDALNNIMRDAMSFEPRSRGGTNSSNDPKSCKLPWNSGVSGCTCEVKPYYACKTQGPECRDQYGICDPAATTTGNAIKALTSWQSWLSWYSKKATCQTRVNPMNKLSECRASFVADFYYDGKPCVCYESSISAPARWSAKYGWQNYTTTMLAGVRKEFPGMYNKSHIVGYSCAEMGFRYDKKVHPCLRHSYVSFLNEQCQDAYRVARAQMIYQRNPKQAAWNEKFPKGTLLNDDTTERVYSGHCNNGL